jgi:hypothetical protein
MSTRKVEFKTNSRVPPSSFHVDLRVLATAANVVFSRPAEAERASEDAYQKVTTHLPKRHKEETDTSDAKAHQFARLRMKFDRQNLKILRENLYPHASSPPPIGSAILTLVRTTDLVIKELDEAYRLAPPLDDEREHELPDVMIPEALDDATPKDVDYGSLIR